MKTYIIGPSGSGKTTLAQKLAKNNNVPTIDLDDVVYGQWGGEVIQDNINSFIRSLPDQWIAEGVYIIKQLSDISDNVIILRTNLVQSIYRQWKRYFTNKNTREKYSFKSQLKLSINTIKEQYLGILSGKSIDQIIFNKNNLKKLEKNNY